MGHAGCGRRGRGFTLVELMVVLGVIAMLLGLTVSASVAVVERSRLSSTETTLRLLDQAMQEWELQADRKLTWWHEGDPYFAADVHWNTLDVMIISEIMPVIERVPAVQQVARLDPHSVYTYEPGVYPPWIGDDPLLRENVDGRFAGSVTVLDAWGVPIYATHPGRLREGDPEPIDPDGTIRTRNELTYGVARDQRLTFVSAGPDRDFGHMFAQEGALYEATMDNLYSVPVQGPYVVGSEG